MIMYEHGALLVSNVNLVTLYNVSVALWECRTRARICQGDSRKELANTAIHRIRNNIDNCRDPERSPEWFEPCA
jgi:hypothetical protein